MNNPFLILAIANVVLWLGLGSMLISYMRKRPIFYNGDCSDKNMTYPSLSIVVAACNEEESIKRAIHQLLVQDYPNFEVIVINDRSTDHTGDILKELENEYPQLKVITITDLPSNWLGKTHAVYQGTKQAKGEWLLFTDADVMFSPNSLKKAVNYAVNNNLDHLTIGPNVTTKGFFFSSLMSWFQFSITFIFMSSKAAGVGAFNLIRKSTYEEIGSYKALALEPVDDWSLGKLVVKKGYKQEYGISNGLISVKLYDSIFTMLKGIEKNQFPGMNYDVAATLAAGLFNGFIQIYPFLGIFIGSTLSRILCGLSIIIIFTCYNVAKRFGGISLKHALVHPISVSLHLYAILNSMVRILSRGGLEWRGTFYSLKELKKHT
ncbi:glycosyltransferase [Desulfitobacterium metallireducens]|uniref:4,4'-diaponeurosporenoate glycosyltransferase n=1 Tax=Desulfitobacterium metallireducens DSM 15288 TaxID=871968 RepID=W0EDI2_9FIRM|nr:glycosyltransferase family 2 protein [Desulfitobacterium metallireducens]AHF07588.1 glycosyl transferase family 2 [Desulfitobacterium metallireducens DSM 15288]